ncbi:MAG: ricin-type beta-trefoil lectin domain protein [Cytophagales bacterium]|tara:strand:- start:157 stop:711 length:555 start_codon:yes stop_codon:yes gene_type:complete
MKKIISFLFISFISCNEASEDADTELTNKEIVEVYLLNNLNDSRGFCIDMRGHKTNADINKSLQAHTCYSYQGEIAVDQGFNKLNINQDQFFIEHFKVCMEASKTESASSLVLRDCDGNNNQKFILKNNGNINPVSDLNLCLTVSEEFREGGGGNPTHLIRNLSIEICDDSLSSRQKWGNRKIN